jgi:histone deacetylase 1/2
VDTNWYVDSGATNHITGELDKLTIREKYGRRDQVHGANGSGMSISNIGHSTLHTPILPYIPICALHLNNILHVPSANKSLAFVHHIASNNNAFL